MASLPYVTATGNIDKALKGIQDAATPERVSQDFVKTILKIAGGSGDQITSYLKKIGFANPDGSPSELYRKFRNKATAGNAVAQALKNGYAPLYKRNEFMHKLSDADLRGLIIEETGMDHDAAPVGMIFNCIKALRKWGSWDTPEEKTIEQAAGSQTAGASPMVERQRFDGTPRDVGMNLSYTINLNLPATSDIAVFNAIFKSLKENLLRSTNE